MAIKKFVLGTVGLVSVAAIAAMAIMFVYTQSSQPAPIRFEPSDSGNNVNIQKRSMQATAGSATTVQGTVAKFNSNPSLKAVNVGDTVTLRAKELQKGYTYRWAIDTPIGQGALTGQKVTFSVAKTGKGTVTLEVTGPNGEQASTTESFTVN